MQNGISIFIKLHNILHIFINIKNITIVMIGVSFSSGSTYYLSTLIKNSFFAYILNNNYFNNIYWINYYYWLAINIFCSGFMHTQPNLD